MSYFFDTAVNIEGNKKLRTPQIEAYIKIKEFFSDEKNKEALVVLPTGTGKSGLISIAPFGVAHERVLIITPGLVTKNSIIKTQDPLDNNFWIKYDVIFKGKDIPIVNEYSAELSDEHLHNSHIIITNIQKIVSTHNNKSLINRVSKNFFDFIIIDEAHHAPAQSWQTIFTQFPNAKILHVTGTPYRGDGKEIPGKKIHETPLSEVMRYKYVKWLRKETINAKELYFKIPKHPDKKLTKEEVLKLDDKDWIEKSVALSKECSLNVIEHSITKLKEIKRLSPNIPHKILAVGCSIAHAKDLLNWYKERGINSVIVHSKMEQKELAAAFMEIDEHKCDAVISVNMLMEGYDHKYLSILAIFRPYRSLNAFAQVVGRILRVIPESENFEIDNNGIVIFHEEIGLNDMWDFYHKEVEIARRSCNREYNFTEKDYTEKDTKLAFVESNSVYANKSESYLDDIDFNELFEKKRAEIDNHVELQIISLKQKFPHFSEQTLENVRKQITKEKTEKESETIDPLLLSKRPDQARKKLREILKIRTQDMVAEILFSKNLEEKGSELYSQFNHITRNLQTTDTNDAILVKFINLKLCRKYGVVKNRDNQALIKSIEELKELRTEIERMLK
ncbi:DEAD/DEAH box helicase [Snodgrassella alvi]|uniref:Helicase n=1 Tax=Snodgrassella alvi TaxID=1196083 RepID=A0A2N9XWK7_9NEIS|nr:DEAD/DEAH box helicase family protein [Snodgrassella alvi]PIT54090.1 helicase [Snodgrassella alvi]